MPVGPSQCAVCTHPNLREIDEKIVSGQSYRSIARRYGMHHASVGRHARNHLARKLQALRMREDRRGESLLGRIESLLVKLEALAEDTADRGQARLLLDTAGRLEPLYRLLGKLTGELDERPQVVNVLVSPEWQQVRAVLLAALAPYPEARVAVSERLLELEGGGQGREPGRALVIDGKAGERLP